MTANDLNTALRELTPALANHLWQSTAFAAVAGLLALALRRNSARTRHWIWMAASLKFLLPFAMLAVIAGSFAKPRVVAPANTAVYSAVEDFSEPFAVPVAAPVIMSPHRSAGDWLPIACAAVWLAGFVVAFIVWAVRWRRVAGTIRAVEPMLEGREVAILRRLEQAAGVRRPMRIVLSQSAMEPGVFGIVRPVLAWPAGITERLDDAHMETVLAHEVCHVRRRDNLTAMLHMFVEAAFWFHPLVWWMGARLVAERERACDEEVLQLLNRPQVYAESILKVCEFCVESPLECVAGITGADLKQRIVEIMRARAVLRLTWGKKLLIGAAMVCAIAVPVVLGQAKAAQRLMMAAIKDAPKPIQFAAHAMLTEGQETAGGEIAASTQNSANREQPSPDPATASASSPQFDSASIRPSDASNAHRGFNGSPGGRVFFGGPARMLVQYAYGLQDYQVTGGPDWAASEPFVINAVPPDNSPSRNIAIRNYEPTPEQRQMLQALLRERFGLQCHFETKEGEVYILTRGAKPLQFVAPSSPGDPPGATVIFKGTDKGMIEDGEARGRNITIDYLAIQFSRYLRLPVINQTGIAGSWDFHLDPVDPDNQDIPTAVYSVVDRLGLKIKRGRGPVQTLVIDHMEKPSVDGAEVAPAASVVPVAAAAAEAASKLQEFDVVSIKPSDPNAMHMTGVQLSPDHLAMNFENLKGLICIAYSIPYWELSGGEPWMEKDRFDFEAKPPQGDGIAPYNQRHGNFDLTDERLREMMQAMLIDRFHLKFHRDTVTGTVSILEKSGKPLLLVPSKLKYAKTSGEGYSEVGSLVEGRGAFFYNMSMPQLAKFLSSYVLHRPVLDQTGLNDSYDFEATTILTKEDFQNGSTMDMLLPAVKEMGLKLTETTGPVEKFVIDHAERPSQN